MAGKSSSSANPSTLIYTDEQRTKLRQKGVRYFIFREDFLDITTLDGSVVLQKLINFSTWRMRLVERQGGIYDGWFMYTTRLFRRHLRVKSEKRQRRLLRILTSAGYLVIKRAADQTRRRLFWIDVDKVTDALERARQRTLTREQRRAARKVSAHSDPPNSDPPIWDGPKREGHDLPKRDGPKREGNKDTRVKEVLKSQEPFRRSPNGGVRATGTFFSDDKDAIRRSGGWRVANHLYRKLKERSLIHNPEVPMPKWAARFNKLLASLASQEELPAETVEARILEMIDIHVKHVIKPFWPSAFCADTFCDKYGGIKKALVRLRLEEASLELDRLRKEAEEVEEESGFSVDRKGNIHVRIPGGGGRTRVVPRDEEWNGPWKATIALAEYIRSSQNKKH